MARIRVKNPNVPNCRCAGLRAGEGVCSECLAIAVTDHGDSKAIGCYYETVDRDPRNTARVVGVGGGERK